MKMPRAQAFGTRTLSIYRNMEKRFAERRNKKGRILQIGRRVPFTLEQFRTWVLCKLGTEEGTVPCEYCGKILSAIDVQFDHPVPVAFGGELGFQNLAPACAECNLEKGQMTGDEFSRLNEFFKTISAQGAKDAKSRLRTGAGFKRLRFFGKKPKPETPVMETTLDANW